MQINTRRRRVFETVVGGSTVPGKDEVIKRVHHALEYEPRVNLHRYPLRIGYADGAVVLEGEVGDVATKKLTLELAAAVDRVVNRIEVRA